MAETKKPKPSENKAQNVEISARVYELKAELGGLTFEMAKLREKLNEKAKRSNAVATTLEELNA